MRRPYKHSLSVQAAGGGPGIDACAGWRCATVTVAIPVGPMASQNIHYSSTLDCGVHHSVVTATF
jgi:hypothetical protein